jgi:hypothetical protein
MKSNLTSQAPPPAPAMTEENRIFFDYTPRPWQKEALTALEAHRFGVVVAHRRAGKTEALCLRLLLAAMSLSRPHPAPFYGYVAPFLKQAKAVAWDRLKYYARNLPAVVSESELGLKLGNGAAIRLFGADYPDRLRGLGFDGVVLDEVAQMRPETWPAVIRPALSDRQGWAAFIGTPKGQGLFHDLFQAAARDDQWFAGAYPADITGVIEAGELAALRREMGAELFNREYLCDWSASDAATFIDFQSVAEATRRPAPDYNPAPLVLGLDVARFGDDRTALIRRRGPVVEGLAVWRERDLMFTASRAAEAISRYRPRAVFVDVCGLGAGVVDRLRQLGHRVIGVNSGARATRPEHYANLKAEMWARLREWLATACLPDRPDLRRDLLAPVYDYDQAGRLRIESKDSLKSRALPSTDLADALALTLAQMVAAEDFRPDRRPRLAEMD